MPGSRGSWCWCTGSWGKRGAAFSYQVLTDYCRRHGIGGRPKVPSGSYTFEPGEEMQTDTSPHRVQVGGQERKAQCACLILAFSRMVFVQYYPSFDRFWCKVFLTAALEFFGGACRRCVIDNTSVIVGAGVGAAMIPAPEMAAFALRFGFEFKAHAIGHANRKARVERAFHYVENNLLPGQEFKDWEELNREARAWSEAANARLKQALHARPIDLFAQERPALKPLPEYIPPVYRNHDRTVDAEGFIHVAGNRFSVPSRLIGKMLEVREYAGRIEVFEGHTRVAQHLRSCDAKDLRLTGPRASSQVAGPAQTGARPGGDRTAPGGAPPAALPRRPQGQAWATTLCGVRQRQLHQCMG